MNADSCDYVIYMIHACASQWKVLPSEAYRRLRDSGCIDQLLVPHYDILHTQSTAYVVENIRQFLMARGEVA